MRTKNLMSALKAWVAALLVLNLLSAAPCTPGEVEGDVYRGLSRFTDPGGLSDMLLRLPTEPTGIVRVAENLTVHHNLLPYHSVSRDKWDEIPQVWPPKLSDILKTLRETGPGDLSAGRRIEERIKGACMLESHLLAGLLRYREIPSRIRAGYFRDVYTDGQHVVEFWEHNAREKGIAAELLEQDPDEWTNVNHAWTRRQIQNNKRVEHWVVEYWDRDAQNWRILDANRTFLKAMSGIEVDFHLPRRHFEYAFESWKKMRNSPDFNQEQYEEWPQDGQSHIRSQLLWDFFSLLNHDIAGYDKSLWGGEDSQTNERVAFTYIKERKFEDLSDRELEELDRLADLLKDDPARTDLVNFYWNNETVQLKAAEEDPHSFVYRQNGI